MYAIRSYYALYFDDDHLSIEGSKLLLAGSVLARDIKLTNASSGLAEASALVPRTAVSASRLNVVSDRCE